MRYAAMLWGNVKAGIGGGNDGITPHIGTNGNWWIDTTDTGIPATGPQGLPGADGADGQDGTSTYTYVAYASDDAGTDFTTTFDPALDYIAILATDTEIPSPAVGDFAGLWKNLGGSGSEYLWYLHQKPVPPISEPTNVQISVNGSGSIMGSYPAGFFQVWAVNENGATLPVDVPAFDVLDDTTSIVVSWDEVTGATGYICNSLADGIFWSVLNTSVDLSSPAELDEIPVPTENTTGFKAIVIENEDVVDVVGDGINVEFIVDEIDSTKKTIKITQVNEDWTVITAKDIEAGTAQEYIIVLKARKAFTIDSLVHECDDGSLIGVAVKIDGVPVTGLDNITVSSTETETAATATNLVAAGQRITFHTTTNYTGNPTLINIQLNFTR